MFTSSRSRSVLLLACLGVGATLSATTLSACSATAKDAVRVNGESLSNQDFDDLLSGYAAAVGGAQVESGNVNTAVARGLILDWVNTVVLEGVLDEAGIDVTDEQRDAARTGLSQQGGFLAAPVAVQDFYVRASATLEAAGLAFTPSEDDMADLYGKGPTESEVVCLRLILTNTQEDVEAAVARITAGESFADVAKDVSTDTSAADGGILTDQQSGSACVQLSTLASQIVPEFVTALRTADVGVVSPPFEVPGVGWVTILLRPYSEVAADVGQILGPATAGRIGRDALATARIWISPEYGRWDPETQQIVDTDR
ncbi:MAG: peptidylprolyl isomerase [Ilumatobacteraceae bacterium]